ncbi:DoxX family protein [Streptomyces endophytica]|uniref:DoxX family protein n=1 Tax=Streptomyces endophytica TaxID=2991496 RepID=A0ABY6PG43_9ACTN|nr:DoxX family protein [Streptomyces endophytica]UZJ32849.1 DoxX family protein [Streptomyces endophytica]
MRLLAERRPDVQARSDTLRSPPLGADLGLLLLRLAVGLLMAGHGAQKLFGFFGGHGLGGTGRAFAALGFHPGRFYAGLCGASEFLGGLGLAAGLFTPLAAAAVIGVMINAMILGVPHGLWTTDGGIEYPLCLGAVALSIAAIGPGRFALDRPFRWRDGGLGCAAFALGVGGLGAALIQLLGL